MNETIWHPASELPPLHEESFEEDGVVYRFMVSDWRLVIDDTCDGVFNGPMRVARLVQVANGFQWEDGGGRCGTVTSWAPTPKVTKKIRPSGVTSTEEPAKG